MTTDLLKGIKELWHVPSNTLLFNGGVVSDILLYKTSDNSQYGDGEKYYFYKDFVIISRVSKIDVLDIKANKKIATINNSILFLDEINGFIYYRETSTLYRFNLNDFTTKSVKYNSGLDVDSDYRKGSSTITSKAIIIKQGRTVNVIDMGLNLIFSDYVNSSVYSFDSGLVYALNDGNYLFKDDYFWYLLDSSFKQIKNLNIHQTSILKISNNDIYATDTNSSLCKFTYRNGELNTVWKSTNKLVFNTLRDSYIVDNKLFYFIDKRTMIFDINTGELISDKTSDFFKKFMINGKDSLMIHREQYAKNVLLMKGDFDKINII